MEAQFQQAFLQKFQFTKLLLLSTCVLMYKSAMAVFGGALG